MLKLIHVTDLHLPLPGRTLFGLDPYARLDSCLEHINANHADADLLVIAGDLTHDGDAAAYAALADRLDRPIPPVYLMIGNHDKRTAFFAAFPETAVANGFAQGVLDTDEGRLIFLDTMRDGHDAGELCAVRLNWLDHALAGANGAGSYIFMHHPPFAIHLPALDGVRLADPDTFHEILQRHGNVRHIFAGHVHRPTSGTWRGIAFNTLPGTAHQSAPIFTENRFATSYEAPAYGVVFIDKTSTVVHTIDFLQC